MRLGCAAPVLVTLAVVSDMSYAWVAMADYSPLMRARIQRNPFSVLKLRATFLKLVSILEAPLMRINEASSPDLSSVSQYAERRASNPTGS